MKKMGKRGGSVRLSYGQLSCKAQKEPACKLALGRAERDSNLTRTGQGTVRQSYQNQHSSNTIDADGSVYYDHEAVLVEDACSVDD